METNFKQDFIKGIRIGTGILTALAAGWASVSFATAAWGALPNAGTTLSSAAWNDIVGQLNTLAGTINISSWKVGIGTSNPLAKLHISGNGTGGWDQTGIQVGDAGTSAGPLYLIHNHPEIRWNSYYNAGNFYWWGIGKPTVIDLANGIHFLTSNASVGAAGTPVTDFTESMRISSNWYVGIGTTSPQSALQVVGNFIQIPTLSWSAPAAADCNEASEAWRMVVYTPNTATPATTYLYVCPQGGGWIAK